MIATLSKLHEQIRSQVAAGEPVDHAAIHDLCAKLKANPDAIPPARAKEVIRLINAIAETLQQGQESLMEELGEIQRSRNALQGYSQLRSATNAQRLRRQV